jgi:hypothetical protein
LGAPVASERQKIFDNQGNIGWIDNRKYPIVDNNNEIIGLFGIARDITETEPIAATHPCAGIQSHSEIYLAHSTRHKQHQFFYSLLQSSNVKDIWLFDSCRFLH